MQTNVDVCILFFDMAKNTHEVIKMKENKNEEEQEFKNKFNSGTNSQKVQNQNDTHNSVKEGLGPNTKR